MSYTRFGRGSDVYVFMDVRGFLHCCMCSFGGNFHADTTASMIDHLKRHEANGDGVPSYVYEDLWLDDTEDFPAERD